MKSSSRDVSRHQFKALVRNRALPLVKLHDSVCYRFTFLQHEASSVLIDVHKLNRQDLTGNPIALFCVAERVRGVHVDVAYVILVAVISFVPSKPASDNSATLLQFMALDRDAVFRRTIVGFVPTFSDNSSC